MSANKDNFMNFVAVSLSTSESMRNFKLAMQELAAERSACVANALDPRQRDAIYGSIEMCFRIVDEAESALNAMKEKANSGRAGGFQ